MDKIVNLDPKFIITQRQNYIQAKILQFVVNLFREFNQFIENFSTDISQMRLAELPLVIGISLRAARKVFVR